MPDGGRRWSGRAAGRMRAPASRSLRVREGLAVRTDLNLRLLPLLGDVRFIRDDRALLGESLDLPDCPRPGEPLKSLPDLSRQRAQGDLFLDLDQAAVGRYADVATVAVHGHLDL